MRLSNHRSFLSNSKVVSAAILVGLLCIQFHSLSHIDFTELIPHNQSESSYSEIKVPPSGEEKINVECPDCILTSQIQADSNQGVTNALSHSFTKVLLSQNEPLSDSTFLSHKLRAPPV